MVRPGRLRLTKENLIDAIRIYTEEAFGERKAELRQFDIEHDAGYVLENFGFGATELVLGVPLYDHSKMHVIGLFVSYDEELESQGHPEYVLAFFPNQGRDSTEHVLGYKKRIEERWIAEGFPVDRERYS